jgi:uncharacterized protein
VLFGSRARGDARPDSDYDVAVFVHDYHGLWDEAGPPAEATTEILYDTEEGLTPIPFPAEAYRQRTALMNEIRQEGIDLGLPRQRNRSKLPDNTWRLPTAALASQLALIAEIKTFVSKPRD